MSCVAAILIALLAGQDVTWKTDWAGTLKEAAASRKLVLLAFISKDRKNCVRFRDETLASPAVTAALSKYLCVRMDPEGTDDENRLWQAHDSPMPPITLILEPDGKKLAGVGTLNPKLYSEALNGIRPAYFEKIVPAREALAKDPNQADKLADLGEAYILLNNPAESAMHYRKATDMLASRGDKPGALRLLGGQLEAYYEKKWYVPARAGCAKLLELDPDNGTKLRPKAAWIVGMAACDEGNWKEAIDVLADACAKYKESELLDRMLFSLGSAHMYAGDKEKALATFDQIVKDSFESEAARLAKIQADKLRGKK
jgi:tetratricopeptide (TPR) repeat protein